MNLFAEKKRTRRIKNLNQEISKHLEQESR